MTAKKTTTLAQLREALSKETTFESFETWIVGRTPLICHAWSEKAKQAILAKQLGSTKPGKEPRDPEHDFVNSLYPIGENVWGFPATGLKNALLSASHKDKGIARTTVMASLWLDAEMVRVMPAKAGAICDMPLVRLYGSKPEMREDMVRIGSGITKIAALAYRAQFSTWAILIRGEYTATVLSTSALAFIIKESGRSIGIGDWRNEKKGMFGAYYLPSPAEEKAWDKFAAGKGPLPGRPDTAFREAAE